MSTTILAQYQRELIREWQNTVKKIITQHKAVHSFAPDALATLQQYMENPGKFVRPSLFLYGCSLSSKKNPSKELITLAMSFELLHLYLLIQDDIMDQSDLRRGGPSLHKRYEAYHQKNKLIGDSRLYGETMAILMSDLLSNEAEKLWTTAVEKHVIPARLRHTFDHLKEEVYWGQYYDVALAAKPKVPSLASIIHVMKQKTGAYTMYRPMQIGALLGEARKQDLAWLKSYTINLGVCFQIIDDILGTFGEENITGKSTTSDILERKYTPLVYYAFKAATPSDKKMLFGWYAKRASEISAQDVKAIFVHYHVVEQCRILANRYIKKSLRSLQRTSLSADDKKDLTQFAEYIMERVK